MIDLFIIADDFTGALDTGVQFSGKGIRTLVSVGLPAEESPEDVEVLVIDTETRHDSAEDASRKVAACVRYALKRQIPYLYKKTDSALRGNVGAELSALLRESGETRLAFVPAYPKLGRVTRGGIQYVDGIPVHESAFGQEPFNPVRHSDVAGVIREQSDLPVMLADVNRPWAGETGITVYDACDDAELRAIAAYLQKTDIRVFAGCAGFAAHLPELLGIPDRAVDMPVLDTRLFVMCGSIHPVTQAQVRYAAERGFVRIPMLPEEKIKVLSGDENVRQEITRRIEETVKTAPYVIFDTADEESGFRMMQAAEELGLCPEEIRQRLLRVMGEVFEDIYRNPEIGTMFITGGDTLHRCMEQMGIREVKPVCEITRGTVIARLTHRGCVKYVITKSGGFGEEMLITEIASILRDQGTRERT